MASNRMTLPEAMPLSTCSHPPLGRAVFAQQFFCILEAQSSRRRHGSSRSTYSFSLDRATVNSPSDSGILLVEKIENIERFGLVLWIRGLDLIDDLISLCLRLQGQPV